MEGDLGSTGDKSGESQGERGGGVEGLAVFVALSGAVSLRKAHSVPASTQPLLSPLPKVELFSRPPAPPFRSSHA